MKKQIKSKQRVVDFGEVYTNEREVNAMLDLVKHEANRIDSRFLEPAAGNGNFLIKILERKLKTVCHYHKNNQSDYEIYAFLAISSIYGIDILEDNIHECRERLFEYLKKQYRLLYKEDVSAEFLKAIWYILKKNLICGDTLSGLTVGENPQPIIFSEWTITNQMVKRRDFSMNDLLVNEKTLEDKNQFLKPHKSFKPIHFKEVFKLN